MNSPESSISPEEAKKILDQDTKARIDACAVELKQILDKHACELDGRMVLRTNHYPSLTIAIVPKNL